MSSIQSHLSSIHTHFDDIETEVEAQSVGHASANGSRRVSLENPTEQQDTYVARNPYARSPSPSVHSRGVGSPSQRGAVTPDLVFHHVTVQDAPQTAARPSRLATLRAQLADNPGSTGFASGLVFGGLLTGIYAGAKQGQLNHAVEQCHSGNKEHFTYEYCASKEGPQPKAVAGLMIAFPMAGAGIAGLVDVARSYTGARNAPVMTHRQRFLTAKLALQTTAAAGLGLVGGLLSLGGAFGAYNTHKADTLAGCQLDGDNADSCNPDESENLSNLIGNPPRHVAAAVFLVPAAVAALEVGRQAARYFSVPKQQQAPAEVQLPQLANV